MSINSNSYELDSFITQQLCSCYDSDCRVPDFFSLIQPESPIQNESKTRYCGSPDAYSYVTSDTYKYHPYIDKEQIILDQYQYPEEVKESISIVDKLERIYLSYFPLADFFYCTVNNKLILFDNKGTFSTIIAENIITACDIALPDKFIYETKNVSFLLIYSTENSVTLLPIGKTCDKIYESKSISIQTSFIPTTIKAYPTEFSSNIFIGSNTGDVFGLFYKFNQAKAKIDVAIKNLSSNIFLSLIPKFLRFIYPIIDICYDSTTEFLAAVDSLSNIRFFKYNGKDKKLTEVSRYEPQMEGLTKEKIISINDVPISDSEYTRFVCITENGERLFFGTNPGVTLNDEIHRLQKMYVPLELADHQLISSGFFLNSSIFVYPNFIAIFHPYYNPHQPTVNPKEFFDVLNFTDAQPINIVVPNHKYQNQTFRLYYHELMWEHIEQPSYCYLMCATCYYKITLARPVDSLQKLIRESKGHFTVPIREWMSHYGDDAESPATLLLLASENLDKQIDDKWPLAILYQYSTMKMNQVHPISSLRSSSLFNVTNINSLTPTCAGFIQRASKLLSLVWQTPVLTQNPNNEYCLSPIFRKLPPNLKKQLQNLITLSTTYLTMKRSQIPSLTKNEFQRKQEADESAFFDKLREYLQKIIEILTFIDIVSKQNSFINDAIKSLKTKAQERLTIDPFGSEIEQISLYDALREFAGSLLVLDPDIYQLFTKECSNFFSTEDREIIDVTSRLENNHDPENSSLREEAREIYLKYINQPFKLNKIVELFSQGEKKYSKGIIDVCLSKANACDPRRIALQWYNGNRSRLDYRGRYYFDLRYECYKFIFQLIESQDYQDIDQLLTSNDELFHICLYHKMLISNQIEKLLSFTSRYIEPFLEEYAPDFLWIYSSRHNNYAQSADLLFKMIKDEKKDFKLDQRIRWLRYVAQLASADNQIKLRNEAISKLKLAEIQSDLKKRVGNDEKLNVDYLLDPQKLFDGCCDNFHWDLVLKFLAFSPISGQNRTAIISKIWSNYFQRNLLNEDLATAAKRIEETCMFNKSIPDNEVCNPSITLPIFEEHRLSKGGSALWAVDTMILANFDINQILNAYLDALENKDISQNIRFDFSYAAAYLISKKADPGDRNLYDMKKYFLSNAKEKYENYEEAAKCMSKF